MKKLNVVLVLLVVCTIFCLTTCDGLFGGTIILGNYSPYAITYIELWIPEKGSNETNFGKVEESYTGLNVPRITGNYEMKGIPAGRYFIDVGLSTYPFVGTRSPVFELKGGKTIKVNYSGPNSWVVP